MRFPLSGFKRLVFKIAERGENDRTEASGRWPIHTEGHHALHKIAGVESVFMALHRVFGTVDCTAERITEVDQVMLEEMAAVLVNVHVEGIVRLHVVIV